MNESTVLWALIATAFVLAGCGPSPWEKARTSNSIEAIEAFIAQNPDSEHVDEAKAIVETLWQARWDDVAKADSRSAYVEFVRSGAPSDHVDAAREAVMALQEERAAASGKIEMSGIYGPSGLIEDVDTIATRYEGVIAGLPATVEYSIKAGNDANAEQQYFSFDWTARVLTLGAPADVQGVVELQTEDGATVKYELFGLIPGPDNRAAGSFLVGRGPDLLWSSVKGMSLAPTAGDESKHVLEADEAVLFAINEHMSIEYVP